MLPADRRPGLETTLASMLQTSYSTYAGQAALVHGEVVQSYAELGEQAHRLARGLHTLGVCPQDRIVILSANCPEFIIATHAIFVGGYVRVALGARLHPMEIIDIVQDCRPRAIFLGSDWVENLSRIRDQLTSVEQFIVLDGSAEGMLSFSQLVEAGDRLQPTTPVAADDLCALIYTSGTTGRPKGAMLTHANWVAMVRNSMVELPPVETDDVVLHVAPLSHLSGYVEPTYSARGACHVVSTSFQPPRVLEDIRSLNVTILPLVPTMLNMLVSEADSSGNVKAPTLRVILYGGSAIAPSRLAHAVSVFGDVFVQFYGLSEVPMPLSCLSRGDHRFDPAGTLPARLASAGRVNPFVELRICGPSGEMLPAGSLGEITVRSDTIMAGYWHRPDLTCEMVNVDNWAATGDLGRLDSDGYLYIVDRKSDMIVTGGYNVYPTEVENIISTLNEVDEVAVVGVPDMRWGEAIKAIVVLRKGSRLTEEDIISACARRLAGYKKPRSVEFVSELPKTSSGKIKRRQLRDGYWADSDRSVG